MITKEEATQYVRSIAEQHILTREELDAAFASGLPVHDTLLTQKAGVADILYYIGGAIVCLGIGILVAQNWSTLGFGSKVLATMGVSIAAYIVGVLFGSDRRTEVVSSVFYMISAIVMPIGLYVVFDNAGFDTSDNGTQTLMAGILFGVYALSLLVSRKSIFTLFSIIFGTWLFFSLTNLMVDGIIIDEWEFYLYRVLCMGLAYILIGNAFSQHAHAPLKGYLYGFGILGTLGAALALGGWQPDQNVFWELIYPGIVFGALFLSVHLRSGAFLLWSTIFLMAYIVKITIEYFSSGLGWPLALVIAGLAMIGVGYMSLSIKKNYLSTNPHL